MAGRVMNFISGHLDSLIGLVLFLAGFYAYTATLAPTVLDGDAALFQYTPYVLGVTYPTGYPFYILLGKVWVMLFPFGELAWRMNLFSALCSAAALPLIYGAARKFLALPFEPEEPWGGIRWAALVAVLTYATIPSFWRWSTEAKIYALNILLFSGVLYSLAVALESRQSGGRPSADKLPPSHTSGSPLAALRTARAMAPLVLPALLFGLAISVHSTTVLLLPGLLLLVWFYFRRHLTMKLGLLYLSLLITPGLLYLYIPLRAEWLLAVYGREEAIARGLLADFYQSGWSGWMRYFTAADFTGGVVTNWGEVPEQFLAVYLPILVNNLTYLGIVLGVAGGLGLAVMRPRLFWPLFLMYALPIPFVLTYGQGEQSAFLLPSFLVFSLFAGYAPALVNRLLVRLSSRGRSPVWTFTSRLAPPLIFIMLVPALFFPQTHYNVNRLDAKWNRAIYEEWADALAHPLEPGAALLAHWGDLTSFWYMQYAEGFRPDLRGLYPPTEEVVTAYLAGGRELYIAGPLQGWAAGIEQRYRLIPWGRLVRIAPYQVDPETLLPELPYSSQAAFDDKLRLIGLDFAPQTAGGFDLPVTLAWQTLTEPPLETRISLRLARGNGYVAQMDDALLSGWFPRDSLPVGQYVLSYMPMPIPLGTLPGRYQLQLVVYTNARQPWVLADGTTILNLGEVEIMSPPADYPVDSGSWLPVPPYDFGGEIELVDYEYSVSRVGQGKGFAVKLLWQAKTRPADNYTLLAELLDAGDNVLRAFEYQPVGGQAPTSTWQPGQFIKDQVDVVLPASAPPGNNGVKVRLSWLRPDGARLDVRRWLLPLGDGLNLGGLTVMEKEGRVFEVPKVQQPIQANLENKTKLIGYDSPQLVQAGEDTGLFEVKQADCVAGTKAACQLHFDFYWQSLSEMELPYSVFLHVVDEQGQIIAQHDRGPGIRAKQPTTAWLPGEVVLDPVDVTLPSDIPPGQYSLHLGMYLPPDGPRLLILDHVGQPIADLVEIGMIQVEP